MLEEAEEIRKEARRAGDSGAHAGKMMEAIAYAQTHRLFTGNVPAGTANEENLAQAVEMAAYILEVLHGEKEVGSVLGLSREQKFAICHQAAEKALADMAAFEGRRE